MRNNFKFNNCEATIDADNVVFVSPNITKYLNFFFQEIWII